ncbi:MAG: hypothetical protein H6728_16510 [Myxococcales bacterium]|nr:hypothetical protein [Myxococcales bacterium]
MLTENPKLLAHEVADGLIFFTPHHLKKFSTADLQVVTNHLQHLLVEVRGEFCAPEDFRCTQHKHQKMQRIQSALRMIQSFRMQHH